MCACGLFRAESGDGHVRWQLIESETKFKNAGHQELYGEVGEIEPRIYIDRRGRESPSCTQRSQL